MIKNFDVIKEQLKELAGVINSFKSEAVQLRLIELIFEAAEDGPEKAASGGAPADAGRPVRKGRRQAAKSPAAAATPKGKGSGRPGGRAMLLAYMAKGSSRSRRQSSSSSSTASTTLRSSTSNPTSRAHLAASPVTVS